MPSEEKNNVFGLRWEEFDQKLLRCFGVRLSEAVPDRSHVEYLIPRISGFELAPALHRARVHMYPDLHYTVLEYATERFVSPLHADAEWRTFSFWLCLMCSRPEHNIILVDAPAHQRHGLYRNLQSMHGRDTITFLGANAIIAWNLSVELDAPAEIVSCPLWLCRPNHPHNAVQPLSPKSL